MSGLVLGVAASHSTLMNTDWASGPEERMACEFRDALTIARHALIDADADVLVCIGPNHFRGMYLDLMPTFTIGVGECSASGEAGTPEGPLAVDVDLARHLCRSLIDDGFDVAFSLRLQIDHGISHALQYLRPGLDLPIVPILVNVFAPPLPSLKRCDSFGRALRSAIAAHPRGTRVAVVASGGLSHWLPWPRWDSAESDRDRFMVQAWLEGRDRWKEFEARRREFVRAEPARINASFDREFLELLAQGAVTDLEGIGERELEDLAGNGGQEIRTWFMVAAALEHARAKVLGYWPIEAWLTGMSVALFEPR